MKLAKNVSLGASTPPSALRTLHEIAELHRKGVITDSEFQTLARVMVPERVEEEIDNRVMPAIERLHMMFADLLKRAGMTAK